MAKQARNGSTLLGKIFKYQSANFEDTRLNDIDNTTGEGIHIEKYLSDAVGTYVGWVDSHLTGHVE